MPTLLYKLKNKKGEFYSPKQWPRYWNREGKFLTRRALSQIPEYKKRDCVIIVYEVREVGLESV